MKKLIVFTLTGLVLSINTMAQIPVVETVEITIVSLTEVVSGGKIISDGGLPITSKGVLLSMNSLPIYGESNQIGEGNGSEDFISHVSGLFPQNTYYLRAFAINSGGIGYGNVQIFTTLSFIEFGSVQDIEGNVYKTVQIDDQNWMAENLKTTTFNDGSPISNITDNLEWSRLSTSAYCWYKNDEETYKNSFGALYNYFAVTDSRGLCPNGWHIPNEAEWSDLHCCWEDYSPCEEYHGDCYLRESETNETGFSARNGGFRQALNAYDMSSIYGSYKGVSRFAFFWELAGDFYWLSPHDAISLSEIVFDSSPMNGYSVRCLENKETTIHTLYQSPTRNDIFWIPVYANIFAADKIIGYQFEYRFDPEFLQFEDYGIEGTLSSNGMLEINETEGKISIAWANQIPLSESGVLVKLCFKAIRSGDTYPVISEFLVNADTLTEISNGTITVFPRLGDVDDNYNIQAYDAALVLQYSVGLDPLPDIDPYPWEEWRYKAANVDGIVDISAYDASLILQYTVGLINSFPAPGYYLKSAADSNADVNVSIENGNIVFRSSGELNGLNVRIEDNSELFGSPDTPVAGSLLVSNYTQANISVGLAMANSTVENEVILAIPILGIPEKQVVLNLLVNNRKKQINLGMITGISDDLKNVIAMYPNPANTVLYFKNLPGDASVTVFDLNGRKIRSFKSVAEHIDISDLASGIYTVQIESDGLILNKKIVKQ